MKKTEKNQLLQFLIFVLWTQLFIVSSSFLDLVKRCDFKTNAISRDFTFDNGKRLLLKKITPVYYVRKQ